MTRDKPERRRRAAAPSHVLRLERSVGRARRVVKIEQSGAQVTVTSGAAGDEGVAKVTSYPSAEAATLAVKELELGYGKKGYAPSRLPPGATARRGVSCRDAALEAAIEADPNDLAGYLVYADWLSSQGDVRGELIRAQLELEEAPDDPAPARVEQALLTQFEKELLGPLAKLKVVRDPLGYLRGLAWRRGFLSAARLWRLSHASTLERQLELLFDHPAGRFLERLVLGRPFWGDGAGYEATLALLEARAPKTLRAIELAEGRDAVPGDLTRFLTLPTLRQLVVHHQPLSLQPVDECRLEELILDIGDQLPEEVTATLERVRFPRLTHLSIPAGMLAALRRLRPNLPALRVLTLHNVGSTAALELATLSGLSELEALVLDDCHLPSLATAAEALRGVPRLVCLTRPYGYEAAVPAALASALPRLTVQEAPGHDPLTAPIPSSGAPRAEPLLAPSA